VTSLRVSVAVNAVSTDALATVPTAVVSVLVVPLLNALLVTAISFAVGAPDVAQTARAAIVAGLVAAAMSSVATQAAMDRYRGVIRDVSPYGLGRAGLWSGKAVVATASGLVSAIFLAAALGLSGHASWAWVGIALGAAVVALPAGVAAGMLSLRFKDAFLLANLVGWIIPVTAGTVVSTQAYPDILRWPVHVLPGTWLVHGVRGELPVWPATLAELAVGCGWLIVARAALARAEASLRSGRSDALPM
jgi:ABC-2 type transport system permease protein